MPRPTTVLYVCTANLCRSPVAERLLRAETADRDDLVVGSAGTSAVAGMPIDPPSAAALRELGGDPGGHRSRVLTPELVDGADLVLTATAAHRDRIIAATPAAVGRVFTMREYARVDGDDDIADPYGRGADAALTMAQDILVTVRAAALRLGKP